MSNVTQYLTTHAIERANQRGIRHAILDVLLAFGNSAPMGSGRECIFMDHDARRRAKAKLGKAYAKFERKLDSFVIIANDGMTIVTCGHRTRKIWRN